MQALRCLMLITFSLTMINLPVVAAESGRETRQIAIIATIYTARSHGNAIGTHFFIGFPLDGQRVEPRVRVASIYIDQPATAVIDPGSRGNWDAGARLARLHGAEIYPTIAEALTLGGPELAVDGVLYIGEHGDYPRNRLGSKMYPRMNHLEQVFRVFDASSRSVPVFCDKHLSYSWLDSKWIYDRARELDVPLMAGSSLPFAWREPWLEHPKGARIEEAVAIAHGALDSYGFHGLEILQSMVERRAGGETGVAAVRTLQGQAFYEALEQQLISPSLVNAALDTISSKRAPTGQLRTRAPEPTAIVVDYNDGLRGTMLLLPVRYIGEAWSYAARVDGEELASGFILSKHTDEGEIIPSFSLPHFGALGRNIENMFLDRRPRAPVERTLLTSGVLDFAFRSLAANGEIMATPFLNIHYQALEEKPIRVGFAGPADRRQALWAPPGYEFLYWRQRLYEEALQQNQKTGD